LEPTSPTDLLDSGVFETKTEDSVIWTETIRERAHDPDLYVAWDASRDEGRDVPHPDLEDISNPILGSAPGFERLHIELYDLDPIIRTIKKTEAYAWDPIYIRLMQSYKAWARLKEQFVVEDQYQLDELREIIREKMKVAQAIKNFIKNYPVDTSLESSFASLASLEPVYKHKVLGILRNGSPSAIQIVTDLLDRPLTYTEIYVRFNELYNQRHPDPSVPVTATEVSIFTQIYNFFVGSGATGNSLDYEIGS
jgi:hypothetical protein